MIAINNELLFALSDEAASSKRKRKNYNFHKEPQARIQRMLNAMEPGTYVRPHKHEDPDKLEVFFCIKGRIAVIEWTEQGGIIRIEILDPLLGNYGVEVPARTWHSLVSLEAGSVAWEVKDGPYDPADDKHFAPWAPAEGDPDAEGWLNDLIRKVDLK
ncbi:MAG: WbuC family cupin fold metalloprotein [Sphingobacteriia bacterium]|nr:WbuC family cupin fold metalloprotein [Sphingobacteriia bacterium]